MAKNPTYISGVLFALLFGTAGSAPLDLDGDGLCDIWQERFNARNLKAEDDTDGDGCTNAEEAAAGTDPFDPRSKLSLGVSREDEDVIISFPTQPGKRYQLVSTRTLDGEWKPVGDPFVAGSSSHEVRRPASAEQEFFQLKVTDADSDTDGVDDWAEIQLGVLDPKKTKSVDGQELGDLDVVKRMIRSWRENSITAVAGGPVTRDTDITGGGPGTVHESVPGTPATFTFSRPVAEATPLVLFLNYSGPTDPTKSYASASDYTLDRDIYPVTNKLTIFANQTSASFTAYAVQDTTAEVPESVTISVQGQSASATLTIKDAPDADPDHETLFVSYLRPKAGVSSFGSGIATVRLNGSNTLATVSATFSNLSSPVSTAQLVAGDSTILLSLIQPSYSGTWNLTTQQSFVTDQAALEALRSGNLKIRISSQNHLNGEIEGLVQLSGGSINFDPPPAVPAPGNLTGTNLERDIVRLLTQATYGPTQTLVDDLKARVTAAGGNRIQAYGQWIDSQFTEPSGSLEAFTRAANKQAIHISTVLADPLVPDYYPDYHNRRRGWWLLALDGKDQLRQRVAFALSQIFVISDNVDVVRHRSYATASYYDMFARSADGQFSTLLREVSVHPLMGYYLSHLGNRQKVIGAGGVIVSSPDENYAREIMQLFSIGLVQLHPDGSLKLSESNLPIPTYSQTDISEMARVFTGWYYSKRNNPALSDTVVDNTGFGNVNLGQRLYEAQWIYPMKQFPAYHDTGAKTVMDLQIPAGQTGEKDLDDVIAYLSGHPNTAPFISRLLIQRLVSANPSRGYVYRVANAFTASSGNLKATVKAILLDAEARSIDQATTISGYGKVREPLLRASAFFRAYGFKSQLPLSDLQEYGYPATELAKFPAGTTHPRLHSTESIIQQALNSPTVFNWFSPDYAPPGDIANSRLVSPEMVLANESSLVNMTNFLFRPIYRNTFDGVSNGTTVTGTLGAIPGQSNGVPYSYSATAHHFLPDFSSLEQLFIQTLDGNGDGILNGSDPALYNAESVAHAGGVILNKIDLMLCAGHLLGRYGRDTTMPRERMRQVIHASVTAAEQASTSATQQTVNMKKRIQTALWLVTSSPEFAVQK